MGVFSKKAYDSQKDEVARVKKDQESQAHQKSSKKVAVAPQCKIHKVHKRHCVDCELTNK